MHGYSTVAPITSPEATEQMLKEFEAVDGISKRWLRRLRAKIKRADWWQTGNDLWEAKSGIITNVAGNSVPRDTEEQKSLGAGDLSPCVFCSDASIFFRREAAPTISARPYGHAGHAAERLDCITAMTASAVDPQLVQESSNNDHQL